MSVGIDIGSKTIKIVELEKEGNAFKLRGSGIVGYQGASPEHAKDEKELAALANVIRKLYQDARISSKEVIIALPETQVFTRTIKFPPLTDQEIVSAVKWEAEQYIPIPISEAIIQHSIIERRENATPPEVAVLLVAAPRNIVEVYVKAVSLAGLNVVAVETELTALARALSPEEQTVLLVDFGARSTDIAVVKNGNLSFTRTIPTAGEAFTRAVAQTLGVELSQAEEYKRAYGMSGSQLEGKIKGALDPVFRMVVDEMKKAIHFYQTEEKGEAPKSVILAGGTAGMPEAISLLTKYIGMEVVIANPFAKVAVDPEVARALMPYAPLYSIAVGLAMREA
ncbi:MAG: Type IV pilus biogenesis protein PilM [Candidatus Curtissbacteria bacterium GW2011_GWC1_44_33]|uniref:Type IV pilus biogenesis protein PilM n=1 Tax=Candidatus Curtissbacteria bacterium GW2011_GWC1_44_33 TaxID=1618413 RepID=A0A0G1J9A1_9BACT|nr:MAG: Type IV pilus biogenesis protein PilM [Candidatus Curtissbacteria bacterium GW2011_GWC1_44_33]